MSLGKLMGQNFIEYASYVIKDRAIPDISDGFKPVQRRILHSLFEKDDGRFNKVANIVGHCMQYHPHGDASIYAALVNLANKEYFIEKQGNFGNIFTGDAPSAARYIECRLTPLAREVLFNKDLTKYVDSYDGRNKEPLCLPVKLPVSLLIGAEGIAVGMATKILPHNFCELLEGQIKILQNEEVEPLPDFLQGGSMDVTEYNQGNGKVRVRAVIDIKGPKCLVIRQVPYGTTTESIINSIDNAAKRGKIKISQVNDYTAEQIEIEIIPARGVSAEEIKLALYAFTDCEVSISPNLIIIKDDKPHQISAKETLKYYTHQLKNLLEAELYFSLQKNEEKQHEKTLIQIFIENRIYKEIEEQKSYENVQRAVFDGVNRFRHLLERDVTNDDVEKLLQIQIKKISRFDIEKNKKELAEIQKNIHTINRNLKNISNYTIAYLKKILDKYGPFYQRRTKIETFDLVDAKKVALANIKVRYDKKKGYLGTEVNEGESINVTDFDRLLYIDLEGKYTVTGVPKKKFIGENLLYVNKFDKNILFNLIYKDLQSKLSYCKRFKIEKFILDKEYQLFEAGSKIQVFSLKRQFKVKVTYRPKKRLKIKTEVLDFSDQLVKGVTSKGNRVSSKEITHITLCFEKHIQETI